ncbi:hypothetical protein Syun_000344 [Stephania yunnanensis]|uniref:Uncharacterized protein n=1 Tax=Stephania yunnanensis TaxID=152371 RepID=A0AAP0Q6P0_9MAGN
MIDKMSNDMNNDNDLDQLGDTDSENNDYIELTDNAMEIQSSENDSDHKPVDPVYDSSPHGNTESLFPVDKEVALSSANSIDSDMVVEVSEFGSPRIERTFSFRDQGSTHSNVNSETEIGSGDNGTSELDDSASTKVIKTDLISDEVLGGEHESNDSREQEVIISQNPSSINNEIHTQVH